MKTYLVVTITCPDRPGIVERITETLVNFSANWEESRMARLGGDFAGIVRISVPGENVDALTQALQDMTDEQLAIAVKITQPVEPGRQSEGQMYEVRLSGADHEGIVHEVAAYLAGQGINVETMETEVTSAPLSGSPLFRMQAQIKTPSNVVLAVLKDNLNKLADELGVDIVVTVTPAA